jgi:hypothetical protein
MIMTVLETCKIMAVQYYVTYSRDLGHNEGWFALDFTRWHGIFLHPSECEWFVPGTLDPNE